MDKIVAITLVLAPCCLLAQPLKAAPQTPYFRIDCVDAETGRGVPLVELRTTGSISHLSDSNGTVAFHEPGLMGSETYFRVASHGYSVPADRFGNRGVRLTPVAGGRATVKLERQNLAHRLYRITGGGIYRDSLLLGAPVPTREPVLNGGVLGQDSVIPVPYRGRLYWFWGDTNRASYPLGNFAASGATSELPGNGGLDPDRGVDLTYFVNEQGFSRAMCPIPGPGPKWIDGAVLVSDETGAERLVASYVRVRSLGDLLERGLVIYDDSREIFEKLVEFDLDEPLHPHGHPLEVTFDGVPYFVFGRPFPSVRVPANLSAIQDPAQYEAFTCLAPGGRLGGEAVPAVEERYAWRRETAAVNAIDQARLISSGHMKPGDAWLHLNDVETGAAVRAHGGSVYWNDYRQRWIAIVLEVGGSSYLGEIWYAEADTLLGPWVYARKIVTHDDYSFYNPTQHPWFDRDGGREVYFEGTYTAMFTGRATKTPRYNYNQIMYRLALDDPRLSLPVPVYRLAGGSLAMRSRIENDDAWSQVVAIPFFALDRPAPGLVEIGEAGFGLDPGAEGGNVMLYRDSDGELVVERDAGEGAVARVWRNPMGRIILAPEARAVR